MLAGGFAAGWADVRAQTGEKCCFFFHSAPLKLKVSCSTSGAHGPSRAARLGSSPPRLLVTLPTMTGQSSGLYCTWGWCGALLGSVLRPRAVSL